MQRVHNENPLCPLKCTPQFQTTHNNSNTKRPIKFNFIYTDRNRKPSTVAAGCGIYWIDNILCRSSEISFVQHRFTNGPRLSPIGRVTLSRRLFGPKPPPRPIHRHFDIYPSDWVSWQIYCAPSTMGLSRFSRDIRLWHKSNVRDSLPMCAFVDVSRCHIPVVSFVELYRFDFLSACDCAFLICFFWRFGLVWCRGVKRWMFVLSLWRCVSVKLAFSFY